MCFIYLNSAAVHELIIKHWWSKSSVSELEGDWLSCLRLSGNCTRTVISDTRTSLLMAAWRNKNVFCSSLSLCSLFIHPTGAAQLFISTGNNRKWCSASSRRIQELLMNSPSLNCFLAWCDVEGQDCPLLFFVLQTIKVDFSANPSSRSKT